MKILLVNPNRIKNPPVIPIGLEYLKNILENYGYSIQILDLCFETNPAEKLKEELSNSKYDIVGFTIRNIDSAIYFNNEYFLPEIKKLILLVKEFNIPVILGGSGFSAMPQKILNFLEADYGIIGPGEIAFPKFLKMWSERDLKENLIDGWKLGLQKDFIQLRNSNKLNYDKYITNGGIVGFQTHIGCPNSCPYCIEAKNPVSFRNIPNIIQEIKYLVNQGHNHFHLCDSEFNCNLKYCLDFCQALINDALDMKWTLYMTPSPYSERLFELLSQSKAYLITLTVDSNSSIQSTNNYSYEDLENIIKYCDKYKIEIAIDLLVGSPYESLDSIKECLNFFKIHRPKTVGISFYYRIYDNTSLAHLIKNDIDLQKRIIHPHSDKINTLEPIFYNNIKKELLEDYIINDDLFRIAGIESGVNYQL